MNMTYTLEQIEDACSKATPGPWVRQDTPDYGEIYKLPIKALSQPLALVANEDNTDFIALARTALPELVARVRDLEGENAALRRALFKFAGELCDSADQVLAAAGCADQSKGGVNND